MKKGVIIFVICLITVAISFYIDPLLRSFIRFLFKYFQGDHINFVGKPLYFFPSNLMIISFGVFSIFFTLLFYSEKATKVLFSLVISILIFLFSIIITSYIDSYLKVINSENGVAVINYSSGFFYDSHILIALIFIMLCVLVSKKYFFNYE